MVEPLRAAVRAVAPDLVVVSGDLTQRARPAEFQEAQAFLRSLPGPQIVVPGNHDVPLYNVAARFLTPFAGYRKYISADLEPHYDDAEIVVQGLNTARSFTWKNGRINAAQLALVRRRFAAAVATATRILVTHHPFDMPGSYEHKHLVGRAAHAMPVLAECGADVLLAGHYHQAHAGDTSTRYDIKQFAALVIQAGTAISTRRREEPNSFNLLHVEPQAIAVDRYVWHPETGTFTVINSERFGRTPEGWRRTVPAEPSPKEIVVDVPPSTKP